MIIWQSASYVVLVTYKTQYPQPAVVQWLSIFSPNPSPFITDLMRMYFSIPSVKITLMKYLRICLIICLFTSISCTQPKPLVYHSLNHFGADMAGLKNTVLTMDLCLYNPNYYGLKLKNTDVDVYINDRYVGKALIREKVAIPKRDTFTLPILLRVDLVQAIPDAVQLLITKEITLKLTGIIRAGKHGMFVKIPVSYEGKQKIK